MRVVLLTVSAMGEAEALANAMVEARLAACVQILPQMTSIYFWEGKVQQENEHLMLIKTLPEKWDKLRDLITERHSYDVPEIISIDADQVSHAYLDWIKSVLA
jgi:periplasmic divalent cation tolerance protein